jgi:hypothetical protein
MAAKKTKTPKKKAHAKPKATARATRFIAAGHAYLPAMYADDYYPNAVVDRVKAQLEGLVAFLEVGKRSLADVQAKCDAVTEAINALEEEFDAAGSEIETVAREDIGDTVGRILVTYDVAIDVETAIRNRDW